MIPLLIGLVGLFAVRRALRDGEALYPARWVAVIAALALLQIWLGRGDLARYRVTLLGLRHAVAADGGAPRDIALRVSGDYDEADLYVPGAGNGDVARLIPRGDSLLTHVGALPADDAGAVFAVEERGRFGRRGWRLLGASPLTAGDTVVVRGGGRVYRLVVETVPDTLRIGTVGIPLPWTERHVITEPGGGRVVLPAPQGQRFRRLRGAHPSIFARAYPLADIVHGVDPLATALPPLGSFLFYGADGLSIADLDSETDAPHVAEELTVWAREAGARRAMVAALPLRDYPEIDLTVPERYGIRPLRTLRFDVHARWLDALLAAPEVQAFDRAALEALRLPADESDTPAYRVRVSHARNSMVREAIVFDAPPRAFAAGSQAILALPENPKNGGFDVVTPSGTARWTTGRPMPLGTADRSLLVRVDGQATSAGFWLVHAALFAAVGLMLHVLAPRGAALALAITATGILAVRLLLGISAMLEFPFVGEGHQLSLWMLPVVPWAIVIAGETGARARGASADRGWRFHGAYALAMIALSIALFPDSVAKQLVLALLPLALIAALTLARAGITQHVADRLRAVRLPAWAVSGPALGVALLAVRALLDLIGWREGVQIGGTRIAVSVLFLPAALLLFAWLVCTWDRRIRLDAGNAARAARTPAHALFSIGAFLLLGFVAVAAWISDFGIILVGLPGIFLVLASLGVRWASPGLHGRLVALAYALPLVLFVLLQASPHLLVPAAADVGRADVRMSEWNRNELLLLERGDPQSLRLIGQRRSEALAVMRETMRSYTRGNWFGKGFLDGRVSHEIQDTATREHAVSALLASQWGLAGTLGLTLLLLCVFVPARSEFEPGDTVRTRRTLRDATALFAVLLLASIVLPAPFDAVLVLLATLALLGAVAYPAVVPAIARADAEDDRDDAVAATSNLRFGPLVSVLALAVFACSSLYIVLANYGLVFFTGKNVYLLGLDSVSDALEGLILLVMGAAGWIAVQPRTTPALTRGPRAVPLPRRPGRLLQRGDPVPTP